MVATTLEIGGPSVPQPLGEVEVEPAHAKDFAAPGSGQNQQFDRVRGPGVGVMCQRRQQARQFGTLQVVVARLLAVVPNAAGGVGGILGQIAKLDR
jgi:hypothetical protein